MLWVVSNSTLMANAVDTSRPRSARLYGYYPTGRDNYPADQSEYHESVTSESSTCVDCRNTLSTAEILIDLIGAGCGVDDIGTTLSSRAKI
jgi:S-adenosyl methyltransferase